MDNFDIAKKECSRCNRYVDPETKEVSYDCLPKGNLCAFFDKSIKNPVCSYFDNIVLPGYLGYAGRVQQEKKRKRRVK